MFFGKEDKTSICKDEKIAVIGDSPLAFFLQAYFHNMGYECKLLLSENQANSYRKLGTFTVRSPFMPNFRHKPEIISSGKQHFDFYIIASSAESFRGDIFFIPDGTNSRIINLSSFYNHHFLSQLNKPKIINGYAKAHISLNSGKDTLDVYDKDLSIVLSSAGTSALSIGNLFSAPAFSINFVKNFMPLFWQDLCLYFTEELLLATFSGKISELLQDMKSQRQISGIIGELKHILQPTEIHINEGEVLSGIYAVPSEYRGLNFKRTGFINFSNLFSDIRADNTPKIYNLLMQMSKKYIV